MKLAIPDKFLPKALRSDTQAIKKITEKKRVISTLRLQRTYLATLQQDELKLAVQAAKDPIRPRRDILYAIYDECLPDGHFTGEYEKAINKVVGSPYGVYKKGSDTIDEVRTRLLQRDWFEEYRTYFEEAVFWGHSLVQFVETKPSKEEGVTEEFSKIDLIPRMHVRPEEGFIVIDISDEKGIPFRDETIRKMFKLVEMGKANDIGKLRIIAREVIWKNYSRSDWSRHSEKFAMPIVAIKAATTNDKELDKLEEMAKNFGNNLWIILDPEDDVDLKEPTFKDSYQIYKEKALMCNDEMSKASTWQTGTSDEKAFVGGAEVHERILDEYTEWRKRKQTFHINDVLFPFLIENGYPLDGYEFRYLTYDEANPEKEEDEEGKATEGKKGAGGGPAKKPNPKALYKYRIR